MQYRKKLCAKKIKQPFLWGYGGIGNWAKLPYGLTIYDDYNDGIVNNELWAIERINNVSQHWASLSEDSTNKFIQISATFYGDANNQGTGQGILKAIKTLNLSNATCFIRLAGVITVLQGRYGSIGANFGYVNTSNTYTAIWGISAGGSGYYTATKYGYVWARYEQSNNIIRYFALDNTGTISETTFTPTNFKNFGVAVSWTQDWKYSFNLTAQIGRIFQTQT
jgi:hypothetical protein